GFSSQASLGKTERWHPDRATSTRTKWGRRSSVSPENDQGLEPAIDHPPAVERHLIAELLEAGVGHHFFMSGVAGRFVRPDEPREHHFLAAFQLHGLAKIGVFTVGHI